MSEIIETLTPVKYDINLATIAKYKEQYMPLKITDIQDQEQFDIVHNARMVMVKIRTTIDKARKRQKATALAYGRQVDAEAKKLLNESMPIENHLKSEEDKVLKEKERIEAEEEHKARIKIQGRVNAFAKYGIVIPFFEVAAMAEDEFQSALADAKRVYEIDQERIAREEQDRKALEIKLATERAENARIRQEQEAQAKVLREREEAILKERARVDQEKRRLEEEKSRREFEAKAKIQAEKDAREKAKREFEEAKNRELKREAWAQKQAEMRPDKEKMAIWIRSLREIIVPPIDDDAILTIAAQALRDILQIADNIEKKLEVL